LGRARRGVRRVGRVPGGQDPRRDARGPTERRARGEPRSAAGIQCCRGEFRGIGADMTRSRRAETHPLLRAWASRRPGQLLGKGHPAGDFLEAYDWHVLEESPGVLRIRAHLPAHVRNPRGQLFGGFTPTYVDLVALFTVRAGEQRITERLR